MVDAYGGQEAETVLCRDQNTFVLGTVDACRIAFGGNFQLVIFRFFDYLTDAKCVSGRVICLGDLNRIAFVLFASGCEHFLYFLFFHYIAETYFTRYGHLVGLGGCDGYRIGMNTKVSFLHAEREVEFFQLFVYIDEISQVEGSFVKGTWFQCPFFGDKFNGIVADPIRFSFQ